MSEALSPQDEPRDPQEVLRLIRKKTKVKAALTKRRDAGKFKSVSAAISLQKVEQEIVRLRSELPTLQLIPE